MTLSELALMFEQKADALEKLDYLAQLRPQFAEMLVRQTESLFEEQEEPDGTPWPMRTWEQYYDHPMLLDTHEMYHSAIAAIKAGEITRYTSKRIDFDVDTDALAPYASEQRLGTDKIAPREFMGYRESTVAAIAELVAEETANLLCR